MSIFDAPLVMHSMHCNVSLRACLPHSVSSAVEERQIPDTFKFYFPKYDPDFSLQLKTPSISHAPIVIVAPCPLFFSCLAGSHLHRKGYLQRGVFPAQTRLGWNAIICFGRDECLVSQPTEPRRGRAPNRWDHELGERWAERSFDLVE